MMMLGYNKNRPETIQQMFGSIAKKYDKANGILSLQMHKHWNAQLVKQITSSEQSMTLLDLCCGTGDIAFRFLKKFRYQQRAILVDFCEEMLTCAKEKAKRFNLSHHDIKYIQANVQELPLASEQVHCVSMAYGIRNVKDPLKCLQEAYRVLKPGGMIGILELTKPMNPLIRFGHSLYLRLVLPVLGKWITANQEAYQYLCNSIGTFVPSAHLEELLKKAGFVYTEIQPLTFGAATIFIGWKPHKKN
jgi:demethylmenaquinone methyltransferase / 2-methoxy-6-polyprenyl-1,4-benzoquinol methylase